VGSIVLYPPTETMIFNPDAEFEISGGHYLIAMGGAEQLRKLERLLEVRN
jgi:hypothetical protein